MPFRAVGVFLPSPYNEGVPRPSPSLFHESDLLPFPNPERADHGPGSPRTNLSLFILFFCSLLFWFGALRFSFLQRCVFLVISVLVKRVADEGFRSSSLRLLSALRRVIFLSFLCRLFFLTLPVTSWPGLFKFGQHLWP